MVQILQGPTAFPTPTCSSAVSSLSILSYNILLPNSEDGWWTYKMYSPAVALDVETDVVASWDYRRDLIRQRIQTVDPTIVCFQEVSPLSFDDDFDFMQELGYDGRELFRKGRFRPATFWKTEHVDLVAPAVHKDRTLLTAFQINPRRGGGSNSNSNSDNNGRRDDDDEGDADNGDRRYWYVLNCHLQAGPQGPRRVRQMHEGVRSVLTLARKLKEPNPEESIRLLVCGDMNGEAECGAVRYLEDGRVDNTLCEDGEPVTSSEKRLPLTTPLYDVMARGRHQPDSDSAQQQQEQPPPTMVVSELISLLVARRPSATGIRGQQATAWEEPEFNDDTSARLTRVFHSLATGRRDDDDDDDTTTTTAVVMTRADVERWLTLINGRVGRGNEFREAARQMKRQMAPSPVPPVDDGASSAAGANGSNSITTLPPDGVLTLEGFLHVYRSELRGGRFWGIAHDLAVLRDPLPITGSYTARYDRLYASSSVRTAAVMDFASSRPCPNDAEPSDHLPIAASFVV